jgi:thioredoxin-like negative regulator of GroEL
LWGKYLAAELPTIYGEQAAAVVIFVSAEYAARDWTRHERRAALGRAVRERREYVLPARFDDTPLPGLLPDVSYVDLRSRTPQQFAAMIVAKLAKLGISPSASLGEVGRGPPGGIPVSEADPRRLGVHAAISVPGVQDEIRPEYVPRDADAAEHGVRARVAAASERGGFVLLVGGSSVGKTRCAVEAVQALLSGWWLVHPDGPAEVAALAAVPSPRMVVWLDELQRYLDGEHGLTGAVVRALLNAPHPVVIIGTLWPGRYTAYITLPAPGGVDPHTREREVLDLADVVRISPEFSEAEQDRARAAAARDPRLRIALEAAGYGLTQTLAAAPQLVARWEDARSVDPYAWAVLTAALDAARLGARAPLSADLLRAAAPGYCTSQQRAEAPESWFEQALAYATCKLHGAAAALVPAGTGMGQIAGYIAADYLIQHADRERRSARVPTTTWDAVLSHIRDPADAARLADSARNRLLYRYAIPLYRHAADVGHVYAGGRLADLLVERGDPEQAEQILRARDETGDEYAAVRLADLLAKSGDTEQAEQILRTRAEVGNGFAADRLADLLADRGDLGALRTRADAGDEYAAGKLADLLAERGDTEQAEQILRAPADSGDWTSAWRLADLLAERGDLGALRARADAGDGFAAGRLAGLLAECGDTEQAEQILRVPADSGDELAASGLAGLLAKRGDLGALRARAHAGDGAAAHALADLLAKRGDTEQAEQILRARADADADDVYAAMRLADLLAKRGDLGALRARADVGDGLAARQLAKLLAKCGDANGLRARANAGDEYAADLLGDLLVDLLGKQGRDEEAERLRRFGLNPDGSIACE